MRVPLLPSSHIKYNTRWAKWKRTSAKRRTPFLGAASASDRSRSIGERSLWLCPDYAFCSCSQRTLECLGQNDQKLRGVHSGAFIVVAILPCPFINNPGLASRSLTSNHSGRDGRGREGRETEREREAERVCSITLDFAAPPSSITFRFRFPVVPLCRLFGSPLERAQRMRFSPGCSEPVQL